MIGYETLILENVKISVDKTTKLKAALGTEIIEGSEVIVTAEENSSNLM